jgi:hypothetical protein
MQVKTNLKAGQIITVNIGELSQSNSSTVEQANVFQISVQPPA